MIGKSINKILEMHLKTNQIIDFLSIDVEGLDEKIIRSLDFNRYRPRVILFEDHGESHLKLFLEENGYQYLVKLAVTTIMIESSFTEQLPPLFK